MSKRSGLRHYCTTGLGVAECCDFAESDGGRHMSCGDEGECTVKDDCWFYAAAIANVAERQRMEDIA